MKTDNTFTRIAFASGAAFLVAALMGSAWAQAPAPSSGNAEASREKLKEKIESAQETKQGAREEIRDAREGARDTARDDRRDTRNTREAAGDKVRDARETAGDKIRDAREGARDTVRDSREGARDTAREDRQNTRDVREGARDTSRDGRQVIRDARRDAFAARREFIAERIRSGDLGLWVRSAADRLMVTDVAGKGAIAQSGLKEGDEIVSVNGQPVNSEREFVDFFFTDHGSNQPVRVVIKRNGQEQALTINPKPFIDQHLASENRLHDFGLILDESDPAHVKVQAVVPRSPAFYAGVRIGDRITSFNGQRITAVADLVKSITSTIGEKASVEVNRNNQTRQLDIDVPNEHEGDQTRTALKPTLPATTPAQPQGSQRAPTPNQPRLNPPR